MTDLDPHLQAGTGRSDITPPPDIPNGMWMAQRHVRAEGIHQALWLTALALRHADETVMLVDIDWCILSNRQDRELREAIHQATGIPLARILPFCTHNHAGPVTQDGYRGEGRDEVRNYVASLPAAAQHAARQAMASLEPVRVASGYGRSEVGRNRNLPTDTGRIIAGPNPEEPSDDTVGVVRLERHDGTPKAILVNYACHPTVLGPENRLVSPDFPGTTKRVVEEQTGAISLFLQGAAGDIGPSVTFVGDAHEAERIGRLLGLEAARVALTLDARPVRLVLSHVIESGAPLAVFRDEPIDVPPPTLAFAHATAELPLLRPLPDILADAPARLAQWSDTLSRRIHDGATPAAMAEAHQHVERERLRAERAEQYLANDTFSVDVAAVRIGATTLACSWGEPYSRIARDLREDAPVGHATMFAGYLGGDPLYVVPADGYVQPRPFQLDNCPFREDAYDLLVDCVRDVVRRVATA